MHKMGKWGCLSFNENSNLTGLWTWRKEVDFSNMSCHITTYLSTSDKGFGTANKVISHMAKNKKKNIYINRKMMILQLSYQILDTNCD